jgi:hypothetical protein
MNMENPQQESGAVQASAATETLEHRRELMQEAIALMDRLSEERFTFIDPETGMLVTDGAVMDLNKDSGEWVVTVRDSIDQRLVRIGLSHMRNIELIVK